MIQPPPPPAQTPPMLVMLNKVDKLEEEKAAELQVCIAFMHATSLGFPTKGAWSIVCFKGNSVLYSELLHCRRSEE